MGGEDKSKPNPLDDLRKEPKLKDWIKEMQTERTWTDGQAEKELLALYKMFLAVAKDRKATKKEINAAEKAGKEVNVGGGGDNTLTKDEFVKKFSKKVKVYSNGKMELVQVANAGVLFDQMEKNKRGESDGRMSVEEFMTLMLMVRSTNPDKKLELAFKMFDVDGSGSLNKREITSMLLSLVKTEDEAEREKVETNLTQEYLLDEKGDKVIGKDGKPKKGLLDELILRADGEMTGDAAQMAKDGKGDGKVTFQELQGALKDCGWLKEYLGDDATKDAVINSTFTGRSSFCLVM